MTVVDALLIGGRLLLAVVFALAGVTKLLDRPGARRSLTDFGMPAMLAQPFSVILPIIELVIAAALLPVPSAAYGAAAALALLVIFVLAIGVSLAHGRAPDCHCFGQLHSKPVGARVLVRNVLLAFVAVVVMTGSWNATGPSVVAWLAPLTPFERTVAIGFLVLVPVAVAQMVALAGLWRQNRSILERLASQPTALLGSRTAGKSIGMAAPGFALSNLRGETITLDRLRARRKPVVLVFSDPNCGPCVAMVPEIGTWQRVHADALTVALVSRGTVEANLPTAEEQGIEQVLLQADREVAEAYGVWGTPSAVVIRPDGTIGSLLAQAEVEIRQVIATLTGDATVNEPSGAPPVQDSTAPQPVTRQIVPDAPTPVATSVTASTEPTGDLLLNGRERPALVMPVVPRDVKPLKADCVQDEMLPDGSLVLYNGCRKQVITLNATAALVWECCDGEHDTDAMVAEVRDVFPAAAGAERDVREVLETLAQAGMIAHPAITAVAVSSPAAS